MSDLRVITASDDLAAVVDRGAELDKQIKELSKEDSGVKSKIIEQMSGEIQDGEVSVKIQGNEAVAVLTASESMSVDSGAEQFPSLRESLDKGFLQTVVEEKISLIVPPEDVERAAQILKDAGIDATTSYSVSAKAVDVRKMRESESASVEETEARNTLESCLSVKTTHRIKYEK